LLRWKGYSWYLEILKKLLYQESAFIRALSETLLLEEGVNGGYKIEFVNKALRRTMNQFMIQYKDPETFL
jgi:hypothetical protein